MKTKFLIALFLIAITIGTNIFAQVKVVRENNPEEKKENVLQYDSTDISIYVDNPKKYIGQRAIYYKDKDIKMLFTKDYKSFGGEKKYEAPLFTYFDVIGFKPPQEFELKRVDNGDICYYTQFGETKPIILVAYYEKYKNINLRKKLILEDKDGIWVIEDIYVKENKGITHLLSNDTTKIEIGLLWNVQNYSNIKNEIENKYVGIEWVVDSDNIYGFYDSIIAEKGQAYCVFKDKKGNTYRFRIDRTLKPTDLLPRFTKEDAVKYIPKFGLKRWKEIINSDVKIGMTKEMVLLSVGYDPLDIIKITDSSGKAENWQFFNMDILFVNGIVKQITEH